MDSVTDRPWLVEAATDRLAQLIRPEWVGWEWGSGGSTRWLARRLTRLTSVEHDRDWAALVRAALDEHGIRNVEMLWCDKGAGYYEAYADTIVVEPDESLDLILVDGRARPRCVLNAIPKTRPGGVFVLDNSEREYYQAAIAAIPAEWERHDYRHGDWTTSLWLRPEAA